MPTLIAIRVVVTMPGIARRPPLHVPHDARRAFGLARVVGAADPDRAERHAIGADRPAALRAGDTRLAVGVPVAPEQLSHRD